MFQLQSEPHRKFLGLFKHGDIQPLGASFVCLTTTMLNTIFPLQIDSYTMPDNREIDIKVVDSIINDIKALLTKGRVFMHPLHFGVIANLGKPPALYIIDGQHRISAFKRLQFDPVLIGKCCTFTIESFRDMDHIHTEFCDICRETKHTIVDEGCITKSYSSIIRDACIKYFTTHVTMGKALNPANGFPQTICPQDVSAINLEQFINAVANNPTIKRFYKGRHIRGETDNRDDLYDKLYGFNVRLQAIRNSGPDGTLPLAFCIPLAKTPGTVQACAQACDAKKCWIGLTRDMRQREKSYDACILALVDICKFE